MGRIKLIAHSKRQHKSLESTRKMFKPSRFHQSNAFSLSPESLRSAILNDLEADLVPFFLCATVGTTSTTAVDPVGPLCDVAKEYNIWVHVDAAYGGSACICPEFRHFIDGVEGANSFSLNAHKWFLTNLDCCCLWVKDPSALINSLSTKAEYSRNKASDSNQVVDYKDWQIALSRRFRAMKLWIVLRTYGVANLRNLLRSHVNMAQIFEGLLNLEKRFGVVVPRTFAMVCFRVSPSAMTVGATLTEESMSERHGRLFKIMLLPYLKWILYNKASAFIPQPNFMRKRIIQVCSELKCVELWPI
ncbi:Tyrosine decarboxylase [Quillaja saponaria]|uniref:Tyrosine decarboxylase n=1 Tax=Quillaja saponaria TaxID=32244 RepID=A0AAD7PBF4_QUISA|nr:Tyrosine decarboxylase [Quillaja saponaria]